MTRDKNKNLTKTLTFLKKKANNSSFTNWLSNFSKNLIRLPLQKKVIALRLDFMTNVKKSILCLNQLFQKSIFTTND
jgi:hypothetical protein